MTETSIDRVSEDTFCSVYTSERKFITKLKEYANLYPDEVEIKYTNTDGSILAHVPFNWLRFIKPPTKRAYTEEQKAAMSERMKKAREKKV